jgi:excisionase family DNA binding protein
MSVPPPLGDEHRMSFTTNTNAAEGLPSSLASAPLAVAPREGCRLLSIGMTNLYALLRSGELESFRIGRARRISTRSIADYVARRVAAQEGDTSRSRQRTDRQIMGAA